MKDGDIDTVVALAMQGCLSPWPRESFSSELANPLSIMKVAESNGNVVGYVCASCVIDEGHILDLAVHYLYRRMGMASALMKEVLEEMEKYGCRRAYLEVRTSNRPAIRLYERLGFVRNGKRREYYSTPREDAVLMTLEL